MSEYQSRFVNTEQRARINKVMLAVEKLDNAIKTNCPKGRERKNALQRLEEVAMWANKAIAFEEVDK